MEEEEGAREGVRGQPPPPHPAMEDKTESNIYRNKKREKNQRVKYNQLHSDVPLWDWSKRKSNNYKHLS